ncbi:MAG: hypothetical protein HOP29_15495 [Phycisphaerales bacterium]|nr:hypothetical protein [Phycisphaerales bacterium]
MRGSWGRSGRLALALAACGLGTHIAVAQEVSQGERVDPAGYGPGVIESWDEAAARQGAVSEAAAQNEKARNGAQGSWVVPSLGGTFYPRSGLHNAVNQWGDTRMGIGFPAPVDVQGAYFSGQSAKPVWTAGVRVIGYRAGAEVGRTDWFTQIGETPAWLAMNLRGVDRMVIESRPVIDGGGWYAMDDLTFSEPAAGGGTPKRRVLDFEDADYKTTLTGSGYGGLTWETGTGNFKTPPAIHPPQVPPNYQEPAAAAEDGPGPAAAAGGTATLPQIDKSFIGEDLLNSIPPDTTGAIGPNHYVETVNSVIAIYNRTTGGLISAMTLNAFHPGSSGDPRVLFDHHSQRWIVIITDFDANARIYLAVSQTSSPTGVWFKDNFVTAQGSDAGKWPDYPTLGVDANGIYIAAFMVGGANGMTIWALDKAPLIAPSPSLGTITAFRLLPFEGAIQPAHTYGTPPGAYLLSRSSSTSIRVRRLNPPLTAPTLVNAGFVTISSTSSPADAPAMGSATPIDTGDARLQMAVYRDGSLWTSHTINVSGRAACRWYEIDATALSLIQSGTVSDASLHYYYPSINANSVGGVVMGFSGSNAGTFVNAYYTGRVQSDLAGEMANPVILHAGSAAYNQLDNVGRNRWGDYSYTTVDPVDDRTIWTVQEYARTTNIWGTWIASFQVSDCNDNGLSDPCDLACGSPGGACDLPGCGQSQDCNANELPDDCEADCNGNGAADDCDIASAFSPDCNGNAVPDECDLTGGGSFDCQPNGVPDECDIADETSVDCVGPPTDCFTAHPTPGCDNPMIEACVCAGDSGCCSGSWDVFCAALADGCTTCPPGQAGNGVPDECEIPCTTPLDCTDNDACTDETCNVQGFCRFMGINYNPVVDCCAPATGVLTPIDNGNACTTGSCDPQTGAVTQTPIPDGPADGCGTADPCHTGGCVSGTCTLLPALYGDVNHDGSVDIFDILCVLDGFAGVFTSCSFDDVDIAPCAPDGLVDVFDILGVLDAFAGNDACCP